MACSRPGFPVLHCLPRDTVSCLLSQWCHPTISSSVISFSFCLQSFPASGSFPVSWLFISGDPNWSFSISPSNEYSRLISFKIDLFNLPLSKGLSKSLLQHHNSKASFLQSSAFFMFQLSHPYVTTGKSVALSLHCFFFFPFLSSFLHYCIYLSNLPAVSTAWQTQHQVPQMLPWMRQNGFCLLLLSNHRDHGYCWGERRPEDGVFSLWS